MRIMSNTTNIIRINEELIYQENAYEKVDDINMNNRFQKNRQIDNTRNILKYRQLNNINACKNIQKIIRNNMIIDYVE